MSTSESTSRVSEERPTAPFSKKVSVDNDLTFKMRDYEKKLTCEEMLKEACRKLADKLKEYTQNQQPTDMLISTKPYPNPGILGQLASHAYKDYEKIKSSVKNDWQLLATAQNNDITNGYFGAAYWSPKNYQIVIAHRGTQLSNIGALYTDTIGILFDNYVLQMNSASTFANVVISALNVINKKQKVNFHLFFTGHSLGGWLAQITTFTAKYLRVVNYNFQGHRNEQEEKEGHHAHTVVFDSPGCRSMLLQMADAFVVRYRKIDSIDIDSLDITSYLSAVNRINTCGLHAGKIYRIFPDVSGMSWFDKLTITYTQATHSIKKILEAFDSKTGLVLSDGSGKAKIQEVVDWPISDGLRRGQEYKYFFNWAEHLNDYHPETESVEFQAELRKTRGYFPIRYQTKDVNEGECSIGVFTQSEQKFLGIYQELRKLPEFFKPNNLFAEIDSANSRNSVKDKLATFDIKNEAIHCESAKELQELIPYVKDLLHFFPGISNEVEKALTEPVKKAVIKSHSLNDELEKYCQNFTDDEVLKKTLQNSANKRVSLLSVTEDTYICAARIYKAYKEMRSKLMGEPIILSLEGLVHLDQMIDLKEYLSGNRSYSLILVECGLNFNLEYNKGIIEDFCERILKILENNSEIKVILVAHKDNKYLYETVNSKTQELKLEYESKEVDPLTWNNLKPKFQVEIHKRYLIVFQGQKVSLNQVIGDNFKQIVNTETLVKLISNVEVKIGGKLSVPSGYDDSYYVERKLKPTKIKKEVLKAQDDSGKQTTDIFAISDINQENLRELVPKGSEVKVFEGNTTDNSIRFWILNNDNKQAAKQFQQLCQQNSESNVHWLNRESQNDGFIWQQSQGSLSILRQHIDSNYTVSYSEQDWVNQERPPKIVIISDMAGMGKSTILTHLSKKIKENSPNIWLVRIDLNDHTDKLKRHKELKEQKEEKEKLKKEKSSFETRNEAVEFLVHDLLKLKTPFEQALLKYYCENIHSNGRLIIMFDGFDEISPDYKETVIDLIQTLRNSQIEQLWVTTRPNMRADLENGLQQFAYMLEPFSEDDQKEFLTKFWAQQLNLSKDNPKLKVFAHELIKLLTKSISDKDKEFTGVPLQTRMLAEAFQNECQQFHNSNQAKPQLPEKLDLIELYECFLKKKYDLYQREKNKLDLSKLGIKAQIDRNYQDFIEMHQNMAFHVLFEKENREMLFSEKSLQEVGEKYPNLAAKIFQQPGNKELLFKDNQDRIDSFINDIQRGKERTGIIDQIIEGKPHFIHRTFAEYLVAKFLVNCLKHSTMILRLAIQEFVLKDILLQSDHQVIRAFFDGRLQKELESIPENTWAQYGQQIARLWRSDHKHLYNIQGRTILHTAAAEGNVNIANFLLNSLREHQDVRRFLLKATTNDNIKGFKIRIPSHDTHCTALHLAANVGHLKVVALLAQNGADVNAKTSDGEAVLHRAAYGGKLDVVEWLVEKGADVNAKTNDGETVLHRAAYGGKLDVVEWLVEKGADVNARRKNGETVLHRAAYGGKLDVVEWLVEKGADVNARRKNGETVLHRAAYGGKLDVVEWLVEKGADVNARRKNGETVLHRAAYGGKLDVVEWLVEKGADVNAKTNDGETVLHRAAYGGEWDVVEWLVEKGADVNAKTNDGETVLHRAAYGGKLDVVEWLVEKGADVNAKTNDGETVLHRAAYGGKLDVVEWLVEKGADVNAKTNDGETVLHRAAYGGKWDVVEWLVEKGADVNAKTNNGETVLHRAAYGGKLDVVEWLVEKGADVNAKTNDGETVLHRAAYGGKLDVVEWLVEKGADVNARRKNGETVLHRAAYGGKLDVVEWLVEKGADVNVKTNDGETVLHRAAYGGKLDVVEWLVEKGADVNAKTNDGETVLHRAAYGGKLDVVEWLVEKGADVNARRKNGEAVLHHAAYGGKLDVVEWLVEKGADVNAKTNDGETVLHRAAYGGEWDVVEWLVEKGADVNAVDNDGKTVLQIAFEGGRLEVVGWLKNMAPPVMLTASKIKKI